MIFTFLRIPTSFFKKSQTYFNKTHFQYNNVVGFGNKNNVWVFHRILKKNRNVGSIVSWL